MFQKATKKQSRLRMAIMGPSGSGKTYTSLKIASELRGKIAVIDTEYGSASKYADEFDFDTVSLTDPIIDNYIRAMNAASQNGYDILIIDSLSHAWEALLEFVDQASTRYKGNSFAAWREGTPQQKRLIDAILKCKCHIIATMRSKTEYILEKDERTNRTTPKKVGMAPIQRAGMEYEFDIVAEMDVENNFIVSKTRCKTLNHLVSKHANGVAEKIKEWLQDGEKIDEISVSESADPTLTIGKSDALENLLNVINEKSIPQNDIERACERANCSDLVQLPVDKLLALANAWEKRQ